jgi:hypothetical protein
MLIRKPFFKISAYLLVFFLTTLTPLSGRILAKDIQKDTNIVHWVSPGESLHKIARRYLPLTEELTVSDLIEKIKLLSGIQGSLIRPQQKLVIPLVRSVPAAAKTVPKQINFEARGIYVNRYSLACQKVKRLVEKLIASGGNTVIIDGKDVSGNLSYPSKVNLASEIGASGRPVTRDLAKLINYLHKKDIHVAVRLVLFYDPILAEKRPELALRSMTTGDPLMDNGKVAWVNPAQPAVQDYNLAVAKELAEMGVDEIQFDYIRYPTTSDLQQDESILGEQSIPRHEVITGFLARARKELAPYKVLLSIDVFGIAAWGRWEDIQMTGQRIEDLARYCDVISPMIYPSHFNGPFQGIADPGDEPYLLVSETSRRFFSFLKDSSVTVRPWIQAFPLGAESFGEDYIVEQLRALNESPARGWLLWSAGNSYDVAWKALMQWNDTVFKGKTLSAKLSLGD